MTRESRLRNAALSVPVVFGLALFALPFVAVLVKAPWSDFGEAITSEGARTAARVSLLSSIIATAAAAAVGAPIAWTLARSRARGVAFLRVVVLAALVLPPTVAGTALAAALGTGGVLDPFLDALGVTLEGTIAATILAETFVAVPFFIIAAEAGFRIVDTSIEASARTLGASGWFRFRSITLPLSAPALSAGLGLAWARALSEYGAIITFAGDVPGQSRTLPVHVARALASDPGSARAVSIPMITLALIVVAFAYRALVSSKAAAASYT